MPSVETDFVIKKFTQDFFFFTKHLKRLLVLLKWLYRHRVPCPHTPYFRFASASLGSLCPTSMGVGGGRERDRMACSQVVASH